MSLLHFLCHLTFALVGIFEIYMLGQKNLTLLQNSIFVYTILQLCGNTVNIHLFYFILCKYYLYNTKETFVY
jgi:hypothetical protein